MKLIPLTQGQFAKVDDEDFDKLNKYKWHVKKHRNTFYAVRTEWVKGGNGEKNHYKMHREILGLTNPKEFGDHIDHDGINNQKNNLRVASNSQNQKNRLSRNGSSSKYLGVSIAKNTYNNKVYLRWVAQIKIKGKNTNLGSFPPTADGEIEAAKAYDLKSKEYHGEFANPNFK